jgi:hypothetical protein
MGEIEQQSDAWLKVSADLRHAAIDSDHVLDALVSALVALGARVNATYPVPRESAEAARREGWIHVPSEEFSSLGKHLPIG